MDVRQMMTRAPATCEPTTTIRLAAQLMSDHRCRSIPITASGELVGIVTDRDIVCRGIAAGASAELSVAAVMTAPVLVVSPDDSWETAVTLMADNHIHHLPVTAPDGKLLGVVTHTDIGRRLTNREFGEFARKTSIPHASECGRSFGLIKQGS
jgi:CBS domain-containing protein